MAKPKCLASSHKSQGGDADADGWRKGCANGGEAGVEGAAGGVDVVYQQEVAELRKGTVWIWVLYAARRRETGPAFHGFQPALINGEGTFDIAALFIDVKAGLSFCVPATSEDIVAKRNTHGFSNTGSDNLSLIVPPVPLPYPV